MPAFVARPQRDRGPDPSGPTVIHGVLIHRFELWTSDTMFRVSVASPRVLFFQIDWWAQRTKNVQGRGTTINVLMNLNFSSDMSRHGLGCPMGYGSGWTMGWAGPQILGFQRAAGGPGLKAQINLQFFSHNLINHLCQIVSPHP